VPRQFCAACPNGLLGRGTCGSPRCAHRAALSGRFHEHQVRPFIGRLRRFGPPFYPLEYILRDAAVPDGQYQGDVGRTRYTLLGYPLLTGCSTQDSQLFGELMIQVLEKGVRRYGQ
jgi:hypothetical protein